MARRPQPLQTSLSSVFVIWDGLSGPFLKSKAPRFVAFSLSGSGTGSRFWAWRSFCNLQDPCASDWMLHEAWGQKPQTRLAGVCRLPPTKRLSKNMFWTNSLIFQSQRVDGVRLLLISFVRLAKTDRGSDYISRDVYCLSRKSRFVLYREIYTAQDIAKSFFAKMIPHHGMPKVIISDCDSRFISFSSNRWWPFVKCRSVWLLLATSRQT